MDQEYKLPFTAEEIKNKLEKIDVMEKEIWDAINYVEIAISSFSNNINTVEMGTVVNDVVLTWTINKNPKEVDIDGTPVEGNVLELTGLNLTSNKTWKLTVKDEKDAVDSKTVGVTFLNGAYYGVGNAESITNDFILGLTKVLTSTRARTITVTANEGQYIYYAVPARLGKCTFVVGVLEGGFNLIDTVQFTNALGYTEPYYVYRSTNENLGVTTVNIS